MRKPALCLSLLACILTGASVHAQGTAPTPDQIQKLMEAKSWTPALRAIGQIMPSANGAASANRYPLLMMRGECLVQLKDTQSAVIAFDQALAATTLLSETEAARAMSLLLRKSRGGFYTPITGDNRTPLDLTDQDACKRAMAALFADELPAAVSRVQEAATAQTLPPITNMLPTLRDLHALEQVGTGDDKQTLALVQPLGDRIYNLIDAELTRVNAKVQSIQRAAARNMNLGSGTLTIVNGTLQALPDAGATGLSSDDRQQLRDTITYLNSIGLTCEDLTALAQHYDRDGERWKTLSKRTQGLRDVAAATYEHE